MLSSNQADGSRRGAEGAELRLPSPRLPRKHGLRARIPGIVLNGHPHLRLPNTLNVRLPGVSARTLLQAVPEIAASAGSACHSGQDVPSRVLTAMGIAPDHAVGSIRLTVGRHTTNEEIFFAAQALAGAWEMTRRSPLEVIPA